MSTTQPAPALDAPEVFQFVRSSNSFLETAEIRKLLKQNLGYNSKQVSVSARHSIQYVSIKVRDASVDLARVKAFGKALSTWSMAMDDCVSGQSIEVRTIPEVDAAHAAPFLEEAYQIALELIQPGQCKRASNGADVIYQGFDFVVYRGNTGETNFGGSRDGAISKETHRLALAIARS